MVTEPVDFSTLNLHALKCLDPYHKPPTYEISNSQGAGCFLDAPGYPSYFLRSVYTRFGNSPHKGAEYVITVPGVGTRIVSRAEWKPGETWETRQAKFEKRLRKLWQPLPLEHYRVQAWIDYVRTYFRNCYVDPRKDINSRLNVSELNIGGYDDKDLLPVAHALGIEIDHTWEERAHLIINGHVCFGVAWSSDDVAKAWALIKEIEKRTDRATLFIQGFYPEYQYEDSRPAKRTGDWWELHANQPTPETCPGETHSWGNVSNARHPVNTTSCQVCGWHAEPLTA